MILILSTLNCISVSGKPVVHPIVVIRKNSEDQKANNYVDYFKRNHVKKRKKAASSMFKLINNQTIQAPWFTGSLYIFFRLLMQEHKLCSSVSYTYWLKWLHIYWLGLLQV